MTTPMALATAHRMATEGLIKVDLRNDSAEWRAFAKKLRRLLEASTRSTFVAEGAFRRTTNAT